MSPLDELCLHAPGGAEFPDHDFFKPTVAFTEWFNAQAWLKYRRIVDCGAGRGLIGKTLSDMEVIGVDHNTRPTMHSLVLEMPMGNYPFDSSDVCLIARPCHNGFTAATFRRAIHYGITDMIYIGLERNLEGDLNGWSYELVVENVGEDGEGLYLVYGPEKDCKPFIKDPDYGWGELRYIGGEARKYNSMGGYMNARLDKIVEQKQLLDHDQIPKDPPSVWGERCLPDNAYGWLGPKGEWFPCGYADHDNLLHYSLRLTDSRARKLGFVKCNGSNYYCDTRLNSAQVSKLKDLGFSVNDRDIDRTVADLSPAEQMAFRSATFKTRRQLDGD